MPFYMKRKKKDTSDKPKKSRTPPSLSTLRDKLDTVFSKYIRLRDAMPSGTFRCISCGKIKPLDQADAGHYFSRIHMNTRFDEDNVHAECRYCNRFSADHLVGYRENLIKKIGEKRFLMLEVHAHQTKKWSSFEIEQLIKYYRALVQKLQKDKGLTI